jgi:hypothetical protein
MACSVMGSLSLLWGCVNGKATRNCISNSSKACNFGHDVPSWARIRILLSRHLIFHALVMFCAASVVKF